MERGRPSAASGRQTMEDLGSEVFNLKLAVQEYEDRLAQLYQTEDRAEWRGPAVLLTDLQAADQEVERMEDEIVELRRQLAEAEAEAEAGSGTGSVGASAGSEAGVTRAERSELGRYKARVSKLQAQVARLEEDNRVLAEAAGYEPSGSQLREEGDRSTSGANKSRRLRTIDFLSVRLRELTALLRDAREREQAARFEAEEASAGRGQAIARTEELEEAVRRYKRDKTAAEERADALRRDAEEALDIAQQQEAAMAAMTAAAAIEKTSETKMVNTETCAFDGEGALPIDVRERLSDLQAELQRWREACSIAEDQLQDEKRRGEAAKRQLIDAEELRERLVAKSRAEERGWESGSRPSPGSQKEGRRQRSQLSGEVADEVLAAQNGDEQAPEGRGEREEKIRAAGTTAKGDGPECSPPASVDNAHNSSAESGSTDRGSGWRGLRTSTDTVPEVPSGGGRSPRRRRRVTEGCDAPRTAVPPPLPPPALPAIERPTTVSPSEALDAVGVETTPTSSVSEGAAAMTAAEDGLPAAGAENANVPRERERQPIAPRPVSPRGGGSAPEATGTVKTPRQGGESDKLPTSLSSENLAASDLAASTVSDSREDLQTTECSADTSGGGIDGNLSGRAGGAISFGTTSEDASEAGVSTTAATARTADAERARASGDRHSPERSAAEDDHPRDRPSATAGAGVKDLSVADAAASGGGQVAGGRQSDRWGRPMSSRTTVVDAFGAAEQRCARRAERAANRAEAAADRAESLAENARVDRLVAEAAAATATAGGACSYIAGGQEEREGPLLGEDMGPRSHGVLVAPSHGGFGTGGGEGRPLPKSEARPCCAAEVNRGAAGEPPRVLKQAELMAAPSDGMFPSDDGSHQRQPEPGSETTIAAAQYAPAADERPAAPPAVERWPPQPPQDHSLALSTRSIDLHGRATRLAGRAALAAKLDKFAAAAATAAATASGRSGADHGERARVSRYDGTAAVPAAAGHVARSSAARSKQGDDQGAIEEVERLVAAVSAASRREDDGAPFGVARSAAGDYWQRPVAAAAAAAAAAATAPAPATNTAASTGERHHSLSRSSSASARLVPPARGDGRRAPAPSETNLKNGYLAGDWDAGEGTKRTRHEGASLTGRRAEARSALRANSGLHRGPRPVPLQRSGKALGLAGVPMSAGGVSPPGNRDDESALSLQLVEEDGDNGAHYLHFVDRGDRLGSSFGGVPPGVRDWANPMFQRSGGAAATSARPKKMAKKKRSRGGIAASTVSTVVKQRHAHGGPCARACACSVCPCAGEEARSSLSSAWALRRRPLTVGGGRR